jgi:hypothetical protein
MRQHGRKRSDKLGAQVCKPMEGTVKLRLLLTSALFLFAQIPTSKHK